MMARQVLELDQSHRHIGSPSTGDLSRPYMLTLLATRNSLVPGSLPILVRSHSRSLASNRLNLTLSNQCQDSKHHKTLLESKLYCSQVVKMSDCRKTLNNHLRHQFEYTKQALGAHPLILKMEVDLEDNQRHQDHSQLIQETKPVY